MIEILASGNLNSVQDRGRLGHMHEGVSRSGAMDGEALRYANALIGNDENAAGIEISTFPFRFRCHADMLVAATGGLATWTIDGEAVAPWWARRVHAGQEVVVMYPSVGARVYLAFSGGLDVGVVLGSRSTEMKSGFGGYEGRGLRRGDRLAIAAQLSTSWPAKGLGCAPRHVREFWQELQLRQVNLRVMAAAEFPKFTKQSAITFVEQAWCVSPRSNRQGYRLEGLEPLTMQEPLELLSHGIVPGTVQVPPDGQPIIQLAEANTCGGYPKIATVVESDLWKIGQMVASSQLRFCFVEEEQALDAMRIQTTEVHNIRANVGLMTGRV